MAPDALSIDRAAAVRRTDLGDGAWFELVEGFVADPDGEFVRLRDGVAWQQNEVLRYDRYVPEKRLGAGLSMEALPLLRQTSLHLQARFRVAFTGVAAILYRDGEDFQGMHSDREMRWLDDTLIAIVVLGAKRPFAFRKRAPLSEVVERVPGGAGPDDIVIHPGRGDLLVMGGTHQREWLHGVPRASTPDARISLTWRWAARRGRPDTNPTYGEGRQFSDRPRQPGSRAVRNR